MEQYANNLDFLVEARLKNYLEECKNLRAENQEEMKKTKNIKKRKHRNKKKKILDNNKIN